MARGQDANKYKLQNVPIQANEAPPASAAPQMSAMKLPALNVKAGAFIPGGFVPTTAAAPVKPKAPPAPPVDTVAVKLKALNLNEEEIKAFKEVLTLAAEDKTKRGEGPIGINLFDKISQLSLCMKKDDEQAVELNHCLNEHIVNRKVKDVVKAKGGRNNNKR